MADWPTYPSDKPHERGLSSSERDRLVHSHSSERDTGGLIPLFKLL